MGLMVSRNPKRRDRGLAYKDARARLRSLLTRQADHKPRTLPKPLNTGSSDELIKAWQWWRRQGF